MKKSKIRTGLLALAILLAFSLPASAFVFHDPFAAIQRGVLVVEEKIKTLLLVKQLQEAINTVQTAKKVYEMGRRAVQLVSDPKQWDALKNFALNRLSNIINWEGDPQDSDLYRLLYSLDTALDNYVASFFQYNAALDKMEDMDKEYSKYFGTGSGLNLFHSGAVWAKGVEAQSYDYASGRAAQSRNNTQWYAEQRRQMDQDKKEFEAFQSKYTALTQAAQDYQNNRGVQNTASQQTIESSMQTQSGLSDGEEGSAEAAVKQLSVQNTNMAMLREGKEALEKQRAALEAQAQALRDQMDLKLQQIKDRTEFLNAGGFLFNALFYTTIGSMSNLSDWVDTVGVLFFYLLVITLSLGILWVGISALRGSHAFVPHEVILGLIGAVLFLAPYSPLSLGKVAKNLAIATDAITLHFQKIAGNPFGNLVQDMVDTGNSIGTAAAEQATKDNPDPGNTKLMWSIATMNVDLLLASFQKKLLMVFGFVVSLLGTVSVFVSLLLRNVMFWILMAVGPMFIFLAPIPWARKHLIPRWGALLYGTVLWGPVVYIMLAVGNTMVRSMLSYQQLTQYGLSSVFANAFGGVVIMLMMLISPLLVYGITTGSFNGLVTALGKVGTRAAVAGTGMIAAGAGTGGMAAGGAAKLTGTAMGGTGGFLSGLGSYMTARAGTNGGMIGSTMRRAGSFMSSAGEKMTKAGPTVVTAGQKIQNFGETIRKGGNKFSGQVMGTFLKRELGIPKGYGSINSLSGKARKGGEYNARSGADHTSAQSENTIGGNGKT